MLRRHFFKACLGHHGVVACNYSISQSVTGVDVSVFLSSVYVGQCSFVIFSFDLSDLFMVLGE